LTLPKLSFSKRDISREQVPAKIEDFDKQEAIVLNEARMNYIDSLGLQLHGKRALDAGCGVGYFSRFLISRGCVVTSVDARPELVAEARVRVPEAEVLQVNIEKDSLDNLGKFDVVLAYGLVYHLENPLAGLRNLASACGSLLMIESMVCDSEYPVVLLEDETLSYSQALRGLGTRPSPSFLVMALSRLGFEFIYTGKTPPDHPDFRFEWKNDMAVRRDGCLLRWTLVASRVEIPNTTLISLV